MPSPTPAASTGCADAGSINVVRIRTQRRCDDRTVRGVVPLVVVAACGGGNRLTECPGERPAIADCYVGEFFADCGGTGNEPVLGCNDQGSCLWFTGGCAPDGFVGSDCSGDNLCCHDRWPFHEASHEGALGGKLNRVWDDRVGSDDGVHHCGHT